MTADSSTLRVTLDLTNAGTVTISGMPPGARNIEPGDTATFSWPGLGDKLVMTFNLERRPIGPDDLSITDE